MARRNTVLGALVVLGLGALGGWLGVDLTDLEDQLLAPQTVARQTQAAPVSADEDADFDFYLLALSWSPTYCADNANRAAQQCGTGKRFGFVTHGLWPQFERGYPENCPTSEPREVSRDIENQMLDIMPSRGLIRHQWRKHGTCSGLDQRAYFDKVRAATESVSIPNALVGPSSPRRLSARDLENSFASTNPELNFNEMAVRCDRGRVREIRICLTKDLEPRACREVDARGCQQQNLRLPVPK